MRKKNDDFIRKQNHEKKMKEDMARVTESKINGRPSQSFNGTPKNENFSHQDDKTSNIQSK